MNIKKYISNPFLIYVKMGSLGLLNWVSDERYLKFAFWCIFHKRLDLDNPRSFNEKIQWLKLYDRKPLYTTLVDKYAVKKYVARIIGEKYIIPTLGVWDRFDDIDFSSLPEQFVLKCTHDSGGLVIVKDKNTLDRIAAKKKIERCLKRNFYWWAREWPYKNVKPRIIAEKYMEEKGHMVPEDYKIYCMNGKPKYIVVFHNRFDDSKPNSETVYDINWVPQHISLDDHFEISDEVSERPECLDDLLDIAERLCKNHAQVRLDFYIIENSIYFGEITLSTASGFQPMIPKEMDRILGEELKLPATKMGGVDSKQ